MVTSAIVEPRTRVLWLAVAMVALLLAVLAFLQQSRQQRAELQTHAALIASLASAALVFDHEADASAVLAAFEHVPAIRAAELLRPDGSVLATARRQGLPPHWLESLAGTFELTAPAVASGARVGTLRIQATAAPMWQNAALFVAVVWAVLGGAWALVRLATRRMRRDVDKARNRVNFLAHHDSLTGLANRETFASRLAEATRTATTCSLLLIDLDDFKQVNDLNGHAAGDEVLRAVAARLLSLVGQRGLVARQGGDEFAVLLAGPATETTPEQLAAELIARLRQPIAWQGSTLQVNASVGIAALPDDARQPEEAMLHADAALFQAKRGGKNVCARYTQELGARQRQRQQLVHELDLALERGQVTLHYQPIFDDEGQIRCWEALARWLHPQRGWVPPGEFIPAAEDAGLIVRLGLDALRRVRQDLDVWTALGLDPPPVAINLSSFQFQRDSDQVQFLSLLQELRLDPLQIEFELTESAVFRDLDGAKSIVRALQSLGFRLALDDFGTGYSSLGYLRRIKCDKLKIDRLFVTGIGRNREASMLVQAIIGVAHAMGMQVVAEGVESGRDQRCLVQMGCDLYQGFGLSRPLAPDAAAALMQELQLGSLATATVAPDTGLGTLPLPFDANPRH